MREDGPIDLEGVPSFVSSDEAVGMTDGVLSMTTLEEEGGEFAGAWANFQIATDRPINFVGFEMAFTSDPSAPGLLTLYVNGKKRGVVDEVYTTAGVHAQAMPTPGDLEPGTHVMSFRLDAFGGEPSSGEVMNVKTGWGGFVSVADLNVDGTVDFDDLALFAACMAGPGVTEPPPGCDPADFAAADLLSDGDVNLQDFAIFQGAFDSES